MVVVVEVLVVLRCFEDCLILSVAEVVGEHLQSRVVVEEVAEEWEVSPALNLIMVEASEGVTRSRWLSSPRWQEWQAMVEEEEEEG